MKRSRPRRAVLLPAHQWFPAGLRACPGRRRRQRNGHGVRPSQSVQRSTQWRSTRAFSTRERELPIIPTRTHASHDVEMDARSCLGSSARLDRFRVPASLTLVSTSRTRLDRSFHARASRALATLAPMAVRHQLLPQRGSREDRRHASGRLSYARPGAQVDAGSALRRCSPQRDGIPLRRLRSGPDAAPAAG